MTSVNLQRTESRIVDAAFSTRSSTEGQCVRKDPGPRQRGRRSGRRPGIGSHRLGGEKKKGRVMSDSIVSACMISVANCAPFGKSSPTPMD